MTETEEAIAQAQESLRKLAGEMHSLLIRVEVLRERQQEIRKVVPEVEI